MFIKDEIQTKKGAKVIIDTLRALGVDTIFGYPGGIVLDLYDELYCQSEINMFWFDMNNLQYMPQKVMQE